jgi:predicted  nucleic acid-binding Zn-ribbon protein
VLFVFIIRIIFEIKNFKHINFVREAKKETEAETQGKAEAETQAEAEAETQAEAEAETQTETLKEKGENIEPEEIYQ